MQEINRKVSLINPLQCRLNDTGIVFEKKKIDKLAFRKQSFAPTSCPLSLGLRQVTS